MPRDVSHDDLGLDAYRACGCDSRHDQAVRRRVLREGRNSPGVTTNLQQTLDDARSAMSAFAENMEALKHNFLVRGFFNDRGYFNLASIWNMRYEHKRALEHANHAARLDPSHLDAWLLSAEQKQARRAATPEAS